MYLVVFSHRAFGHLKHWFIKLKIYPEKYVDGIVCIVSNFKRVNKIEGELLRVDTFTIPVSAETLIDKSKSGH